MKKICFLNGNLNHSGGTERVATAIANELAQKEYDVVMLNMWEGDSPFFVLHSSIKNARLYPQRVSFAKNYINAVLKLRKFLKENQIETLVVVESMLSLFSLPAVFGLNIKHITWEHFNYNVDLGKKGRRLARHLSRFLGDEIVTLTEKDREIWLKNTKGRAKVTAIVNPSPYQATDYVPSRENKTVLAVGRLTYQKGFDLLLKSWHYLKSQDLHNDWKLIIVGEGEDKLLLENLVEEYQLNNSVELKPFTKNIAEYYQHSSLYCMSSRFEGFGMVLVEAHTFGLPVVSFDCEIGPSEIVIDKESGLLAQPENIQDLAEKLCILMNSSENEYRQMSLMAKESIKRFNIDSVIKSWIDIL